MSEVLLLGAGNIGAAIAELLKRSDDYRLTVVDRDERRLAAIPEGVQTLQADVTDRAVLRKVLANAESVLSAAPYFLNITVAETARELGVHYFDLTEDVATAQRVRELAEGASTVFVPQCGLAPGFISIAAHDLAKRFETLNRVRMRVGALPLFPSNALKYNLTWSTAGLINEYCNPCHVIHDGQSREVLALEGLEEFSLDGVSYEAFNTSGGLGTLWETLRGKVDYLNYKTIRYPGHCELIKFLCNDLRLSERRKLFEDVLEHAVPVTAQDVVLIFVTVSGTQNGRLVQETYTKKVYHGKVGGTELSAIQITTAAALCAMLDMHREGAIPKTGFVKQEDVSLRAFLDNRFGRYYA
ncbi:MAG: saccharopine dehydrogenase NADP-binding domain-containing protein [Polyangiales bacterium]